MSLWQDRVVAACLLLLVGSAVARAGMPSPLPSDPELVLRLNSSAEARLQTISFFVLGFLLCTTAVWALWNYLRRDFPVLPRLSFGKALAGVLLWGLLFIIVLTMISGARELMTPGAWQKQGFTYKLTDVAAKSEPEPVALRKQQLERLRTGLWHFAATHNGRFPTGEELAQVPDELWIVPESGGLRYQYLPGLTAMQPATLLVYEPELDAEKRFVLRTNGDIGSMRSGEINALANAEVRP